MVSARHGTLRRRREARRPLWAGDYLAAGILARDVANAAAEASGLVLDVGCGGRRYEADFKRASRYVGYDLDRAGASPDVCGHASLLPFRDGAFATVLSTQVLEHVPSPLAMLAEMRRVLAPHGRLILTAPQHWRLHEEPHDYWRFTRHGLGLLLREARFSPVAIRAQGGVWRLVGQAVNNAVYEKLGAGPVSRVVFLLSNLTALALESIWKDEGDTLDYTVIAEPADGV